MSTGTTWQTTTTDSGATEQLGAKLGAKLRGGEVIELRSDLGGGKTTFVRGLAQGLGSEDAVGSPSFTISRLYDAGKLTLHHYDFHRLHEPGLMTEELSEVLNDPQAITVVEWADIVDDVLPAERIVAQITATNESERRFNFAVPKKFAYVAGGK